jgi:hypothetical protein
VCRTSRTALSQREHSGIGGFFDGGGPGDVGVRADQEGVSWAVIGSGGVDVDAALANASPRAL